MSLQDTGFSLRVRFGREGKARPKGALASPDKSPDRDCAVKQPLPLPRGTVRLPLLLLLCACPRLEA
jgi:hypothetical protein